MLEKNITRFDNRIENYVKYRPNYPKGIIDLFCNELDLQKSNIIADIGSGTGISAKLFLKNGNKVFGIEPNKLMRRASKEYLKEFSKFEVINGNSQNTTLKNESIDIIIAAQAFHWFNKAKTLSEFRRISRNKRYVALIWNERQLDTNDFLLEYERFLIEFGTDYQTVRHDLINKETLKHLFKTEIKLKTLQNLQTLDFEGLKGRILSSSYMPSEKSPIFREMIKKLKTLFARYSEKGKITILYDTNVFYTRL